MLATLFGIIAKVIGITVIATIAAVMTIYLMIAGTVSLF